MATNGLVRSQAPLESSCGDHRGWKHNASRAPYSPGREADDVVVGSAGRSWKPCYGKGGLRECIYIYIYWPKVKEVKK